MEGTFTFSRRSLLCSDAARYSIRNDIQQHELQQALVEVTEDAAAGAGFDRAKWGVQSYGDGELAVLPADVSEWTVIDYFPTALTAALARHNAHCCEEMRLRMRLAIHYGLVSPAAGGYAGQGVVVVSRMVNSDTAPPGHRRGVLPALPVNRPGRTRLRLRLRLPAPGHQGVKPGLAAGPTPPGGKTGIPGGHHGSDPTRVGQPLHLAPPKAECVLKAHGAQNWPEEHTTTLRDALRAAKRVSEVVALARRLKAGEPPPVAIEHVDATSRSA